MIKFLLNPKRTMSKGQIIEIPLHDILTNPHQPRQYFDEESLLELADSIKVHGLLQPIIVRKNKQEKYELIAGERRFRATELIGLDTITAIVKDISLEDSAYLAMIENIQRDDLNYVEVAKGYKSLMQDFNLTQTELVSVVGKSQSAIANKIRILNLSDQLLDLIVDLNLSERHSRALLKLKDEKLQFKVINTINKKSYTVKETEKYIDHLLNGSGRKKEKKPEVKRFIKDIRLFTNTIKQAVDAINSSGVDAKYSVREEEKQYTITINIPIEK